MTTPSHVIAQRQQAQLDILLAARAAGGALTFGQMQAALKDVASFEVREEAIAALVQRGDLSVKGEGTARFFELTRPADETPAQPMLVARVPSDLGVVCSPTSTLGLPCGLKERLQAIDSDIGDALRDACNARLPHRLMAHLLDAQRAITQAGQAT